ncbi:TonB-dependent receptor [Campylobacter lari]|nr:TonB-dependent receptor [Campylobacter lari]
MFLSAHSEEANINLEQSIAIAEIEEDIDNGLKNMIVLDKKWISKNGFNSITQALEKIPEVNFVNFGLGSSIDIRGQGNKSNTAVKIMVDGKSINTLDSSHNIEPINSIDINNIERIEVIPGGGSILYGNGAKGGVVNIITQKAKKEYFSFNTNFQSQRSGIDGGNFGFNMSKMIKDGVFFGLNMQAYNKNGFIQGYYEKGYYANANIFTHVGDNGTLLLDYNYFQNTDTNKGYLTYSQINSKQDTINQDENIVKTTMPQLSIKYDLFLQDNLEFSFETFLQRQKVQYLKDTVSLMGVKAYQDGSEFKDDLFGVKFKAKYYYLRNSNIISGYEFLNHNAKRKSLLQYNVPNIILYHNMTTLMDMNKQSHSFFTLNSHSFNDVFTLLSGFRYEWSGYKTNRSFRNQMDVNFPSANFPKDELLEFSSQSNSSNFALELTPSIKYSDTGIIYFKYEKGFISPNPSQLVNKEQKNQKYYSTDLNSEIFNSFEIGFNDLLWNFYGINLKMFYTQSKDEISYIGNPHSISGSWWKYYNIEETRRFGMELNTEQKIIKDTLIFKEGLTYIDAKISKGINNGMKIPYVSKIKTFFGIDYYLNSNLNTFIDLSYYSKAKEGGIVDENSGKIIKSNWIKDYMITNIGLSYNYKNFQMSAGIRNLFDEKYFTYQDSINDQYLLGKRRNYYAEFRYILD